jgi:hypothetical protein
MSEQEIINEVRRVNLAVILHEKQGRKQAAQIAKVSRTALLAELRRIRGAA